MAVVFKCKMCGGDLNVSEDSKTCECEYCGTHQTVPALDNEKKINLFNRANRLRMNSEFDKAGSIYEQIIAEFPEEAEAYWGLCLCNYGVEYVDDPATAKKIPTVHRASFEKLRKDENYELALEYSDMTAKILYQDEAKEIDRIMGEILSISQSEEPYDIFICYKETDNNGGRTPDSVIAQEIYNELTNKGYKVFFSRITLEDKLGVQYEPYIFAALNSAKVMLAIGTDYEYYNAVWVKNEWSRFIKLAAKDKSKILIPCFKDMDAYDLPDEFKGLQSQDMGKLGYIQDLTRGIDKIFGRVQIASSAQQSMVGNPTTDSFLKRAFLFLEDEKWKDAYEYADKVLDVDPENARAYLAKFLSEIKVRNESNLKNCSFSFEQNANYQKACRYGDDELVSKLIAASASANDNTISLLVEKIKGTSKSQEFDSILSFLEKLKDYKDTKKLIINVSKLKYLYGTIENYQNANSKNNSNCESVENKLLEQESSIRKDKKNIVFHSSILVIDILVSIILPVIGGFSYGIETFIIVFFVIYFLRGIFLFVLFNSKEEIKFSALLLIPVVKQIFDIIKSRKQYIADTNTYSKQKTYISDTKKSIDSNLSEIRTLYNRIEVIKQDLFVVADDKT